MTASRTPDVLASPRNEATLFGKDLLAAYALAIGRRNAGESSEGLSLELARLLRRLGSLGEARRELRALARSKPADPLTRREMYGLRASVWRAASDAMPAGPRRDRRERASLAAYRRAFEADGDAWPAAGLASLHRLRGEIESAIAWAGRALASLDARKRPDGWEDATRAEALLVLGRLDEAKAAYQQAPFVRERRYADRASTRRQALRLLGTLGVRGADAEAWLAVTLPGPTIGVVAGHMLDRSGRPAPRFPSNRADAVGAAIGRWIDARGVGFGVASAACGTDLLFHRALRARGAQSRVVLPYPSSAFRATSVAHGGPVWEARFDELLAEGGEWVSLVSTQPLGAKSDWFEYGNEYLEGLALCKAEEIDAPARRLAVWDGREGDGPGGTAATVRRWRARGEAFDVIDPACPERGFREESPTPRPQRENESLAPDVVGLLTADATNYSKLDDDALGLFASTVLERIHETLDDAKRLRGEVPFVVSTWGDAVFVAFDDLGALARFAFDLRDRVAKGRWERVGLPADLSLRIALHAGPARRIVNPVTGRPDVLGSHVSHVARLEPVTPAGTIFASEGFAVLQRLRRPSAATCTLAGRSPWAKGYGEDVGGLPMYRVERP